MGYRIMFYGGLILSIVSLTLTILIFVKYQIKQVIADLTGVKLSKSKQQGHYHYQTDLTESAKRTTSDIIVKKDQAIRTTNNLVEETELLSEAKAVEYLQQSTSEETELLSSFDETTLLEEVGEGFTIDEEMILVDSNEIIEDGGERVV